MTEDLARGTDQQYVAQPGPFPWDDRRLLAIARERAGYSSTR